VLEGAQYTPITAETSEQTREILANGAFRAAHPDYRLAVATAWEEEEEEGPNWP
jgi:hypothetical protein